MLNFDLLTRLTQVSSHKKRLRNLTHIRVLLTRRIHMTSPLLNMNREVLSAAHLFETPPRSCPAPSITSPRGPRTVLISNIHLSLIESYSCVAHGEPISQGWYGNSVPPCVGQSPLKRQCKTIMAYPGQNWRARLCCGRTDSCPFGSDTKNSQKRSRTMILKFSCYL